MLIRSVISVQESVNADYVTRLHVHMDEVPAPSWDALLACQAMPTPFMRHAWLRALQASGSASPETGWTLQVLALWQGDTLAAACPLYLKTHSRGEYVFDHAWAQAYERHGLAYYPKGLVAVPFTPVPGSRLLAREAMARQALIDALPQQAQALGLSSLHVLFPDPAEQALLEDAGWLRREQVQFHWTNQGWPDMDAFLASMTQEKRKKIRQERRKVAEAGVRFRAVPGPDMGEAEWALLQRCYTQTYLEHGQWPYLQDGVFAAMRAEMARDWLLFVAEREGRDMAVSLIALQHDAQGRPQVAYGRYWGALERVDCLHFEACYYQPLAWCLAHGVQRFEGGAQGEHKLARGLLPQITHSAHWLAHPGFAQAVDHYLGREREAISEYREALAAHSPLRPAR